MRSYISLHKAEFLRVNQGSHYFIFFNKIKAFQPRFFITLNKLIISIGLMSALDR